MAWLKLQNDEIVGYAPIAPPSAEAELWIEVASDDDRIAAYLNPPPPIARDWARFRVEGTIAAMPILAFNTQVGVFSTLLMLRLNEVSTDPSVIPEVVQLWNAIVSIANPDAATIGNIKRVAAACNLPFTLDDAGLMVAI